MNEAKEDRGEKEGAREQIGQEQKKIQDPNGLRVGTVILCRAPEDKATGYVEETVKKFTSRKASDQDEDEGKGEGRDDVSFDSDDEEEEEERTKRGKEECERREERHTEREKRTKSMRETIVVYEARGV